MTGAAATQAINAILVFYLLPGALLATFLDADDSDAPLWRWVVGWPALVFRELIEPSQRWRAAVANSVAVSIIRRRGAVVVGVATAFAVGVVL